MLVGHAHILTSAKNICSLNHLEEGILLKGELEFYCGAELEV